MKRIFCVLLMTSPLSVAFAHSKVIGISPRSHATVESPNQISIKLNEKVKLKFCKLKVYRLEATGNKLALNRAAAQIAKSGKATQVKVDFFQQGKSDTLKASVQKIAAGRYVMVWRILSSDGHMVRGHSVFKVK